MTALSRVDRVAGCLLLLYGQPLSLHADLELKEKALARTAPANTKPGRYKPPDQLLVFLESL